MPYTNIELVRKHFQSSSRAVGNIEDVPIRLSGTEPLRLPHAGIVDGSEVVKGRASSIPLSEQINLADTPVSLSHLQIVTDTVVVADNTSANVVYTENADYVIDYRAGTITRTIGSTIASGQSVVVWYECYTVYLRNSDYVISCQNGELTRLSTGQIKDNQRLWIDYDIESSAFSDDTITNAITEASSQMEHAVDPALAQGAQQIVSVAETYLTVSILSRMRALDILQSSSISASSRSGMSSNLLEISNQYGKAAMDIIEAYRTRGAHLSGPVKSRR